MRAIERGMDADVEAYEAWTREAEEETAREEAAATTRRERGARERRREAKTKRTTKGWKICTPSETSCVNCARWMMGC